jgi:RNA polymerase sigma-70 factor (ECF subfamily)
MEQLSARDRELLRLFAWEDLTPGEIATALGCSSNAAKVGLHRARKRLARRLDRLGVDVAFAVGSEPAFDPTIHATKEELR